MVEPSQALALQCALQPRTPPVQAQTQPTAQQPTTQPSRANAYLSLHGPLARSVSSSDHHRALFLHNPRLSFDTSSKIPVPVWHRLSSKRKLLPSTEACSIPYSPPKKSRAKQPSPPPYATPRTIYPPDSIRLKLACTKKLAQRKNISVKTTFDSAFNSLLLFSGKPASAIVATHPQTLKTPRPHLIGRGVAKPYFCTYWQITIPCYTDFNSWQAVLKNMNFWASLSMNALKNYLVTSYAEIQKVTWPTKQQTINYSLLVIILSLGMAVFFAALDFGFNSAVSQILGT